MEENIYEIKIEKIRNNLFLITVFLITILLFKWFIMIIKEAEKENKKNKYLSREVLVYARNRRN